MRELMIERGFGENREQGEDREWDPYMGVVDAPAAVRLIDQISDEITGESTDRACTIIAQRLIGLGNVEAVGVWLIDDQTQQLVRRSWRVTLSTQPVEDILTSRIPTITTGTGDRLWTRETVRLENENSHSPSLICNSFRLSRADGQVGTLVVVTRNSIDSIEVGSFKLLARQLATEIANSSLMTQLRQHVQKNGTTTADLSHFIALIAHELRTPLTGLRGNIQLAGMAARKADFDRVDSRLSAALRSVDLMTALVQNLQDVSHIERGKFGFTATPADLTATLREAVASIERTLDLDQHQIEIQTPESLICEHDPARMRQVFYNLLINAIRYSPRGGTIQATIEQVEDAARISISDRGIGIPAEDQPHIFDAYYRGDNAREFNAKGLGIGLTIGRTTVEQHGGRIEVQTEPNEGSTFIIWLPLVQAAADR